jgi:predicted DNA-binding protein YlxM (UPF0122 family)
MSSINNLKLKQRDTLNNLYWKNMFSTTQIARQFDVSRPTVTYWLKKNNIPIRKPKSKYEISKKVLENLYIKKRLSTLKIAKLLKIKYRNTIRLRLHEYKIKVRTQLEAVTKYKKKPFSCDLFEKAYIIGFRTGDLHVYKDGNQIRVSTSTTHPAQIKTFQKLFSKYTHIKIYPFDNGKKKELRIYCHLNKSFDFLLEKQKKIPDWIIENDNLFYSF